VKTIYEIWHDNDFDLAHWFYLNSHLSGQEVVLRQIPKTNKSTDLFSHLKKDSDLALLPAIKYETPDLILIKNDGINKPKIELVVEFMTHTPQHDHPLQRFTRIYGSAWLGIPSVLVIPQKKEKLEKGKKNTYRPTMYKANPLIYHLFIKTSEITKTPTLLLMWPEVDGYLKYDKKHPTAPRIEQDISILFSLVNGIVSSSNISSIIGKHVQKQITGSGYEPTGNKYELTSGDVLTTSKLLNEIKKYTPDEILANLLKRKESFLYSPQGLKSGASAFRTDPYAGKICAFDILFCRSPDGNRYRNLVLMANNIPSKANNKPTLVANEHDQTNCPFIMPSVLRMAKIHFKGWCPFTERKQQRIYGEIPDLIIYQDEAIYVPRS
jgi:hypothetical protein